MIKLKMEFVIRKVAAATSGKIYENQIYEVQKEKNNCIADLTRKAMIT